MTEARKQMWQIGGGVMAVIITAVLSAGLAIYVQQPVNAVTIEQLKADQGKQNARVDAMERASKERMDQIERDAARDREAIGKALSQLSERVAVVGTNVEWIKQNQQEKH